MLAFATVSRNLDLTAPDRPERAPETARPHRPGEPVAQERSIVLIGLPGAGKSAIGRRLAARMGLPFRDADVEIEAAAGLPITEIFARYGEPHFRDGERRVIARLLAGPPLVLATGGGAFMDPATRRAVTASGAMSVWLRARAPTLLRRVAGRDHRPMFHGRDPAAVLDGLITARHPIYTEAELIVDCTDEPPETTTRRVMAAIGNHAEAERLTVPLSQPYDILVGGNLLARAGALLAPLLPSRRVVVIADANVASRHGLSLRAGLEEGGLTILAEIVVPPGEATKSFPSYAEVTERVLAAGADRRTTVIALGGGVVGDLAGFVAATTLRGLAFVQVPTTLLAQVDSSVGGKTGINLKSGKNLVGAFHQPKLVLADTATLATLPARELRAGWAEVAKHGLLDGPLWDWCEANGPAAIAGDPAALRHAVLASCKLKGAVVAADEREEAPDGGRALLNLGHTFGHAIEAECGYDGSLLHGEAVAIGLVLAAALSTRLGHAEAGLPARVARHVASVGLRARIVDMPRPFSTERLMARMRSDKKAREGKMRFILLRGPGQAFTSSDVPEDAVESLLRDAGCGA
ncbi:3-dehydroquinate synthase [Humitalea rosea]|uniref:Multifunctional fusion protein n=1 Tax=Humitalea rosea TaxID=990373 RepID=A0A2W7KBT1_9PROT|nr:3-dehydroquinate synthase [Humitalea rosea]